MTKNDLIRREEVLRAIITAGEVEPDLGYTHLHDVIASLPSAEAVEVVRCRECEYWKCNPNTKNYGVCRKVSYDDFEVVMESDDFCSYGERREDGDA